MGDSSPLHNMSATGRRAIPGRLRFEILERDGYACRYCGARASGEVRLEIDHVLPVAEGGSNERANLVAACAACNRGKAAARLATAPKGLSESQARIRLLEDGMWAVADALMPGASRARLRRDWLRTIARFTQSLPLADVRDAAALACRRVPGSRRRRFLYFCRICWNRIGVARHG